jgi:hypothetical protein
MLHFLEFLTTKGTFSIFRSWPKDAPASYFAWLLKRLMLGLLPLPRSHSLMRLLLHEPANLTRRAHYALSNDVIQLFPTIIATAHILRMCGEESQDDQ